MGILDKILSQPIEKLVLSNKKPPNKEALRLYREILRFSKTFNWHTADGNRWSEMIAKSARKEFELAREEQDPVLIMKMILTSRESLQKTKEKVNFILFKE